MPVMVVSMNYRLAAWGLLGGKEAAQNNAINLGLYDQRTALEWIRANIEAFGGDKDKVTLWGQSAGSMDVHYHFLDVNTKLFRAAIMESGNVHSVPALQTKDHQPSYDALVELTGCQSQRDTFGCLKTSMPL
jgi:carboxylesterase type B